MGIHEILGHVAIIHNELLETGKIKNADEVFDYIESYDNDIKEHYLKLLLQYYFQQNDIDNLKKVLLVGIKFDMRMDDIKQAFLNTRKDQESVIEFMKDSVVFVKDVKLENSLMVMYEYFKDNKNFQEMLKGALRVIKNNRYVCAYAYKNAQKDYASFFLNKDLLESLKKDLPYLLE